MKQVIKYMKKQKMGAIVNISSGTALMAIPGMSPYSSLKRALVGFSLTARAELEDFGISVSVVYPYITSTNFEKNTIKDGSLDHGDGPPMPGDPPEYVAKLILEAVETGKAEIFAHDFMEKRKRE
jgi:short-subunit dehydrogenase